MSGYFTWFRQNSLGAHESSNSLGDFVNGMSSAGQSGNMPVLSGPDSPRDFSFQETPGHYISSMTVGSEYRTGMSRNSFTRNAARVAALSSNVPTMSLQSPDTGRVHVVTAKQASTLINAPGQDKIVRAMHAFNTYSASIGMANPSLANFFSEGSLRNKTQFLPLGQELSSQDQWNSQSSLLDRSLMHASQFSGMADIYGLAQGGEFDGLMNNPSRWGDSNLTRRWNPALNDIIQSLGMTDVSQAKEKMQKYLLRNKHSADRRYREIADFDGQMFNRDVLTSAILYQTTLSANDSGIASILSGMTSAGTETIRGHFQDIYGVDGINAYSPESTQTAQPAESSRARANRTSRAGRTRTYRATPSRQTPSDFEGSDANTIVTPDNIREVTRDQASSIIAPSTPFNEEGGFDVDFEDFDQASRRQFDERQVRGYSMDSIDTQDIHIVSPAEYDSLERRYPVGGIGHHEGGDHLVSTQDAVDAINRLREVEKNFGRNSDSDRRFYENVGSNALSGNNFDFASADMSNADEEMKKRMMLGGAIVGESSEGGHLWMLDQPIASAFNIQSSLGSGQASGFTRPQFGSLFNQSLPEMDPDPNNWNIVNSDLSIREAMGNGFIVPIKGRDAIFLPSFANPDFSFGLEIESFLRRPMSDLKSGIRETFGYDLDKMGFNGDYGQYADPSIYGRGQEYLTPVMSGTRAFKAGYLLGEQLKMMGDVPPVHRGPDRFDAAGLHVNMGLIPTNNRKDAFRFTTDMMRLQEDVIKRMTQPDLRYNAWARPQGRGSYGYSPYSTTIQPDRLPNDATRSPHQEHGRQIWSQSISKLRRSSQSGMSEYDFYRQHGEHYSQVAMDMPTGSTGKLAKYKSFGMHKIQLMGLMEYRAPMYIPGGDHIIASMAMASKLGGDIYQGAMNQGAFARTNKLIPPMSGWFNGNKETFGRILSNFLGITNPKNQQFMWDMHQKCGGVGLPPDEGTVRRQLGDRY